MHIDELHVPHYPTGFCQQLERLTQVVSRPAAAVCGRCLVRRCEHFIGDTAAVTLEDLSLLALRQAGGSELRVRKVAFGTRVLPEKQVLVGPLEIEGVGERSAHARVLEDLTAGVEYKPLHAGWQLVRNRFLLEPTIAYGRHVVVKRPCLGLVFGAKVDLTGLQGLTDDCIITIEVDTDLVKVILAFVDRQAITPVVLDPLLNDEPSCFEASDPIRSTRQRRFQRRLLELPMFPVVLRQNWQLTHNQRKLAVAFFAKGELDAPFADLFGADNALIVEAVVRLTLGLQGQE